MTLKRSKNLTPEDVREILSILDGWSGPLTWNLLIDAIVMRLHNKYTRQALHKHAPIRVAFEVRKRNAEPAPHLRGSVQLQKAMERIARLEAENQRLQSQNERLLEQFARWSYNAYSRGLSEKDLNESLPEINRKQSPMLVHSTAKRHPSV